MKPKTLCAEYALIAVFLFFGCRKHEEADGLPFTPAPAPIQNKCSYVPFIDTGTVTTDSQAVDIHASHTYDNIFVYLCKIADCTVAVPQALCSKAGPGVGCVTVTVYPDTNQMVSFQPNKVLLTNTQSAGYGTYTIQEYVCQ